MLTEKDLQDYLLSVASEHPSPISPNLTILYPKQPYFSVYAAGTYFKDTNTIYVMCWVLHDTVEAQGTVRHEYAHHLAYLEDAKCAAHGKTFKKYLKQVSGNKWREDLRWNRTEALEMALAPIRRGRLRVVLCSRTTCHFTYYAYRLPKYVYGGEQPCPVCHKKTLVIHIGGQGQPQNVVLREAKGEKQRRATSYRG